MKLYTLRSKNFLNQKDARELINKNLKKFISPCYINIITSGRAHEYYMEESNIVGAKALIIERKYTKASE